MVKVYFNTTPKYFAENVFFLQKIISKNIKFKTLRCDVKRMLRESRKKFFTNLTTNVTQSTKRLWTVLKRTSKSRHIPDRISSATSNDKAGTTTSQRVSADNPKDVANLFNQYFASVYSREESTQDETSGAEEPILTDLTITEVEVSYMLKSLDTAKATGPDCIPAKLLKETADVIAPSLCKLFNKSISSGSLDEWKTSNIVPIHKKGNTEHAENYRPISLLCIISKVLERCVLNNVKQHLLGAVNTVNMGLYPDDHV